MTARNAAAPAAAARLLRIAARPIDADGPFGTCSDRWRPIDLREIAYIFLGSAVAAGLVEPAPHQAVAFKRTAIHLRTHDGGVFRTGLRTLDDLQARLDSTRFVLIHRVLLVNVAAVKVLDLGGKSGLVGVEVGGALEYLPVARRRVAVLRHMFSFPKRVRRSKRDVNGETGESDRSRLT